MTRPLRTLATTWFVLGTLTLLAAAGGCGTGNPHPPGTFERGAFFAERGKDQDAVAAFESFVRRNPTDSLAAEAQFLKGMTYLKMKEYPLAAVEFQILRKDFPTSDKVEEAFFQEGMAYLKQVGNIRRDITGAYEARLHFRNFTRTFPQSRFMPEVLAAMQDISDLMVAKRLEQVKVFKQLHRYPAIAITLDDVLAEEPGSSLLDQVLWERAEVARRLEDPAADGFLRQILERYPESPLAPRAQRRLGGGGSVGPDPDGAS